MFGVLGAGTLAGTSVLNLSYILTISNNNLLLLLSRIIGIGIGDTAYFSCLRKIGPQKGLMLESSAPIMAAVLALYLFSEQLKPAAWAGIIITSIGIITVTHLSQSHLHYRNSFSGIALGLVAASAQAAGIVFSRMVLAEGTVDPLASSLIRLGAGLAALGCWLLFCKINSSGKNNHNQSVVEALILMYRKNLPPRMTIAIIIGTFCALWLQQIPVKFTSAGIAQTLLGVCLLFTMLIGVFQGRKQPAIVWLGLLLGVVGVSLLFLFLGFPNQFLPDHFCIFGTTP